MKNDLEQDDLWELLGKSKKTEVSPFFSRNVLRTVREMEQEKTAPVSQWLAWFRQRWSWVALGSCAAVTAALLLVPKTLQPPTASNDPSEILLLAEKVQESPDYQVINNLDELLAFEENSVWLDSNDSNVY